MRKIFLACTYGHADKAVVEQRFEVANTVAAKIARSSIVVFSQVPMSHPINRHLADLDKAGIGKLWAPIDQALMEDMNELVVIDAPGWEESAGVAREIEFFKTRHRRVSLWSEIAHEFA